MPGRGVGFQRRRLPHVYPAGQALFVSWHLHGCLPPSSYPPGKLLTGQAFVWVDRHLDAVRQGPAYLRQPAVARLVVESIRRGVELGHYGLHAFVVMPNHFWQRESYDHWVRNQVEFQRIQAYIENNPVKAGMVSQASEYPWSSAAAGQEPRVAKSLDAANKSVRATTVT